MQKVYIQTCYRVAGVDGHGMSGAVEAGHAPAIVGAVSPVPTLQPGRVECKEVRGGGGGRNGEKPSGVKEESSKSTKLIDMTGVCVGLAWRGGMEWDMDMDMDMGWIWDGRKHFFGRD